MKKQATVLTSSAPLPNGKAKAILRGGTFHGVQVLFQEGLAYVEHCGLNYKVTRQKDVQGRIICSWDRA